jgi:DNA mismatch repair protein MutL
LLRVTFGDVAEPVPVGAAAGTAVTVRDLFANVPARRKFLRQPGTETGYIQRAVAAYAAVYPAVAFELTIDGRRAFATDGAGDAIAAATAAWGPEVGRAAILLEPLDESAMVPGVTAEGWIGAPEVSRSHRQGIVIFVNGRWVQNRALGFALEEAYHSLLLVGRHPVAAVHIRLDPAAVDVNVHPTKAEVKFVDERAACRAVQRAVHAALARRAHDDLPPIRFEPIPAAPAARHRPIPFAPPRFGALGSVAAAPAAEENGHDNTPPTHPSGVPLLRVLGQIAASYIIAEGPDGMYLIDQHAAHERVLYERILDQMRERTVARQPLLDPLVLDLAPEELAACERSKAELAAIGFEIERWDGGAVAVRAVPARA